MNKIENINLLPDTEPDSGDYTGEDGLLYCGKCRKPKEAYFPEGKTLFGLDRHPAECDCQRAQRIEREAAEEQRRHLDTVDELKRRGFTDPTMRDWTFENDNGRNPQHPRILEFNILINDSCLQPLFSLITLRIFSIKR